jgi:hypothetical protein
MQDDTLRCSRSAPAMTMGAMAAEPVGPCCARVLLGVMATLVLLPSGLFLWAQL